MKAKRFYWGASILFLLLFTAGCQQQNPIPVKESSTSETSSDTSVENTSSSSSISEMTEQKEEQPVKSFEAGSLLEAVSQNNLEKTKEILADSAYAIDETTIEGNSPLNIAVHSNFVPIAKVLIDHGADINLQNNISDSPYLYAGAEGRTEILAYMLEHGEPDQEKVNRFGGNALIPAAEKGHIENVRLLLDDGRANINFQNNYGYTALIEAVALKDGSAKYQEIVRLLLERGADQSIRDNTGQTAMDYAGNRGFTQMQEILASYQ